MDFVVRSYTPADKPRWDDFVDRAKNTTFMFRRDYVEYHSDRFEDASLVVSDSGGALRALLPASRHADDVVSHAGLTYAGFAIGGDMTVTSMLGVLDATRAYLRERGASSLVYKSVPRIYHRDAADEDLHALFVNRAELFRRDILSVIDYDAVDWEPRVRDRLRKAAKGVRAGVEVRETDEWSVFWPLLSAVLERRHGVEPVHSLAEIQLLADRFPSNIQLFGAYRDASMEAGAVVYVTDRVCHVQYSANSDEGRGHRALDLLFGELVLRFRDRVRYFDFGISSENEGKIMNTGLLEFKESFGARAVAHDFYRLTLTGT